MLTIIVCDGCGRRFATEDATGMLAAISGTCGCGGRFGDVSAIGSDAHGDSPRARNRRAEAIKSERQGYGTSF